MERNRRQEQEADGRSRRQEAGADGRRQKAGEKTNGSELSFAAVLVH
jgi:hypothetical protein